jgi:Ca2+-binding RTX toxin-like protein
MRNRIIPALAVGATAGTALVAVVTTAPGANAAPAPQSTPPPEYGIVNARGSYLQLLSAPGQANRIRVTVDGSGWRVEDAVALTAGTGCTQAGARAVRCAVGSVTHVYVDPGDRNDAVWLDVPAQYVVNGGDGDDVLTIGSRGAGELTGDAGNDTLTGGPGDDRLRGGKGADVLAGGAGTDEVSYLYHHVPVRVDLDGEAGDDGARGEGDTVGADVENIYGGSQNDVLIGNAGRNAIDGSVGADWLYGLGGDDVLSQGSQDSRVDGGGYAFGGDGNDQVRGSAVGDTLFGESGNDELWGGPGYDRIEGNGGHDVCHPDSDDADMVECEVIW